MHLKVLLTYRPFKKWGWDLLSSQPRVSGQPCAGSKVGKNVHLLITGGEWNNVEFCIIYSVKQKCKYYEDLFRWKTLNIHINIGKFEVRYSG